MIISSQWYKFLEISGWFKLNMTILGLGLNLIKIYIERDFWFEAKLQDRILVGRNDEEPHIQFEANFIPEILHVPKFGQIVTSLWGQKVPLLRYVSLLKVSLFWKWVLRKRCTHFLTIKNFAKTYFGRGPNNSGTKHSEILGVIIFRKLWKILSWVATIFFDDVT